MKPYLNSAQGALILTIKFLLNRNIINSHLKALIIFRSPINDPFEYFISVAIKFLYLLVRRFCRLNSTVCAKYETNIYAGSLAVLTPPQ